MRRSFEIAGSKACAAIVLACWCTSGFAQQVPAGDIVGVGNFAHIVNDLDVSLAFYRDVLGLEVGVQTEFTANPAIQAMGDTPDAQSRIATLIVPGLALGIELIEYRGIEREAQQPHFVDPGAANMAFRVRDLDALFPAIVQFPGVEILTEGGAPVTIETPNGNLHALFFQDPDGFVVELITEPNVPADAPPGPIVAGANFEPTVADMVETIRFYNDLLGFDFELVDAFNSNQTMAATAGAPGASFRQSRTNIPGTSVPMTLIEFSNIARERHSARTQDPGTTVLQLIVRDVGALTQKFAAAGVPIVSVGGQPVEVVPGLDIAIVRDPNGMLLELVERSPARSGVAAAVETAVQAWADAYNSHDPQRVVARYHSEAAFWGTTSPTLRTAPADVAAYFAGLARRPNASVVIGEKNVRIVGSIAVVTGLYTFPLLPTRPTSAVRQRAATGN